MSWSRAAWTRCSKSSIVPRLGSMAVWPAVGAADGPRAAGVVGAGLEGVVGPLAVAARRWGGWAAGRGRRSPWPPRRGTPLVGGGPQAALGAGEELVPGREHGPLPVDPQGDGVGRGEVDGVGDVGEDRGQVGVEGVDEARSAALVAQGRRPPSSSGLRSDEATSLDRRSSRRAPSSSSTEMSWPAACLTRTSRRQVPKRSVHASMRTSWRPRELGSMEAVHRSLPASAIGA